MRVEVDGVVIALQSEVPPSLDVRDLLAVTDGLDVVGSEGGGRTEQGSHALAETVAHCNQIFSSFFSNISSFLTPGHESFSDLLSLCE